jgi:hypothetical protein
MAWLRDRLLVQSQSLGGVERTLVVLLGARIEIGFEDRRVDMGMWTGWISSRIYAYSVRQDICICLALVYSTLTFWHFEQTNGRASASMVLPTVPMHATQSHAKVDSHSTQSPSLIGKCMVGTCDPKQAGSGNKL